MFRVGDRVRFATCHGIGQVVEAPHEGCCGLVRVRWESGLLQWYGMDSPFLERVEGDTDGWCCCGDVQVESVEWIYLYDMDADYVELDACSTRCSSWDVELNSRWDGVDLFNAHDGIWLESECLWRIGDWHTTDAASVESECMLPHQLDTWLGNGIERCVLIEPLTARRYAWWSKASVALIDPPQVTLCQ